VVASCGVWCCGFQVVGLLWSWGLCVRFAGCCSIPQTGHITLSSTHQTSNLKTTALNTTGSNHCIILLSSCWWAYWWPKHVEQAIRSAIKTSVASSWHFISTYYQRHWVNPVLGSFISYTVFTILLSPWGEKMYLRWHFVDCIR